MKLLDIAIKNGVNYNKEYYVKKCEYDIINPYNGEVYYAFREWDVDKYFNIINNYNLKNVSNMLNEKIFDNIDKKSFGSKMKLFSYNKGMFTFYFRGNKINSSNFKKIAKITNNSFNKIKKILSSKFNKNINKIINDNIYFIGIDYKTNIKPYIKIYFHNFNKTQRKELEKECNKTVKEVKNDFKLNKKCYIISLAFRKNELDKFAYYFK